MALQGVFRDDYYNAINVLPQSQYNTNASGASFTAPASVIAGAQSVVLAVSGDASAQTLTTDTAVNIIAWLQSAVAAAYKAALAGFGAGVQPPPGVPNLFNLTYTLIIVNNNTSAGAITVAGPAGGGVTVNGTNTIAITTSRAYQVSITSPTTITLQNLYAALV
jgi:hypothetical protein